MDKTLQSRLTNPRTEREKEIAGLAPWFHNLHLPDGSQTAPDHPLGDFPAYKWQQIKAHIPENLTGWRVLDIGCNAGFYCFELAKRGAEVTGIDLDSHYLAQAQWAAKRFGMANHIRFLQMQVYDLAHVPETYDMVWFMGVLYHLRYPLLAMDIVARKTRQLMVLQTLMLPGDEVCAETDELKMNDLERMTMPDWPGMAFVEHRFEDDPTNWWIPNHGCVEAMLRTCGMEVSVRPADGIYVCRPVPESEAVQAHEAELRAATGRNVRP